MVTIQSLITVTLPQRRAVGGSGLSPAIRSAGVRTGFRLAAILLCLIAEQTFADITVTTLADSGPGSLRYAIDNSTGGEVIQFAVTGTIDLENILLIDKSLTISGPGPEMLNVKGKGNQVPSARVFGIGSGNVTHSNWLQR